MRVQATRGGKRTEGTDGTDRYRGLVACATPWIRADSQSRMEFGTCHWKVFCQPSDRIPKMPRISIPSSDCCRLQASAMEAWQMLGANAERVCCPQAFEEPPSSSDHPGHGDSGWSYRRCHKRRGYAQLDGRPQKAFGNDRTEIRSNAKTTVTCAQRIAQDMSPCRCSGCRTEAQWIQRLR